MKYRIQGHITAPYASYTEEVAEQVGHQHTGFDEQKGWVQPWLADNDGFCYKTFKDRYPNWQGVYLLVKDNNGDIYETVDGHFRHVFVSEGEHVKKGSLLGVEGNAGEVYAGGERITDKEKKNGNKRGAHCHRGVRPVKKVEKMQKGEHYLRTNTNTPYQDAEGYFYEIIHKDNGAKGWVDPMTFAGAGSRMKYAAYKIERNGNHTQAKIVRSVAKLVSALID